MTEIPPDVPKDELISLEAAADGTNAGGEDEEGAIKLVDESEPAAEGAAIIQHDEPGFAHGVELTRPVNVDGTGATRCRVFSAKLSAPALALMQDQINRWLDGEQVEIKHVAQVVGPMQGKTVEDYLIVTVWY